MPSAAVVVVNLDGAEHLGPCLDSVAALEPQGGEVETIVVDNGSTDGSLALLEQAYPWVRVLRNDRNVGFAAAVNAAAGATTADCLALLNNDMRVDPGWLRALVEAYQPGAGADCVGGVILDWAGERVQFADGIVSFHGAGAQVPFGEPVEAVEIVDGRELPFACGGSMLLGRELFLELGGFDPAYFAYFEDVDLGWRLWLTGHEVRLAAGSRAFHRHHATGSSFPLEQRLRLYERNWLLTLLKNVGDEHLHRILAAALLLLVERAAVESGSERAAYDLGAPPVGTEPVPAEAIARLHAVADVLADLDGVLERRRLVQAARRRSDAEVFRRFGRPLFPAAEQPEYLQAMTRVVEGLGLDEIFRERRATRLLVVADGDERLERIGQAAARLLPAVVADAAATPAALAELAAGADVVLVAGSAARAAGLAGTFHGLLAVDVERGTTVPALVEAADVLTCASEQRRGAIGGEKPVLVLTDDPAGALRELVEEPWRWQASARRPLPEPALALLEQWRRAYGVSQPPVRQLARAAWRLVPGPARRRLRR